MAQDNRSEKQKLWETEYVNRIKLFEEMRADQQKLFESYNVSLKNESTSLAYGEGGISSLGTVSGGDVFELTKSIIMANEGSYTSIQKSDNGHGVSLGKFQWHEGRAKALLLAMQKANPALFNNTLTSNNGSSVLEKLNWASWKDVKFNDMEANATKILLAIPEFQKIQDQVADNDLQGYIDNAKKQGLTDPKAIAYYADLYNQSPRRAIEIVKVALPNGGTLLAVHTAALNNSVMGKYATRRNNTYNKLKDAQVGQATTYTNTTGDVKGIAIATVKNGIVVPPDAPRKPNTVDMYNLRIKMNSSELASLDTSKFSFPNGEHSNMFFPHFAQMLYLLHAKLAPLLEVEKIVISSGLRTGTISQEKKMGYGDSFISPHMAGCAVDIFIRGGGSKRFIAADTAYGLGFRGIGVGADHVHVDCLPPGVWKEHDETKIYYGPGNFK